MPAHILYLESKLAEKEEEKLEVQKQLAAIEQELVRLEEEFDYLYSISATGHEDT